MTNKLVIGIAVFNLAVSLWVHEWIAIAPNVLVIIYALEVIGLKKELGR